MWTWGTASAGPLWIGIGASRLPFVGASRIVVGASPLARVGTVGFNAMFNWLDEQLQETAYNACVITRGIREFVNRDWDAARESKDAYWGERIARLGPVEGFRVADELRRQMLVRDPAWPDATLRQMDLASHVRLAELLRRAGTARRP